MLMAVSALAMLVGEDPLVKLMSVARLLMIAAAMARLMISTATMMVALASVHLAGKVTLARPR